METRFREGGRIVVFHVGVRVCVRVRGPGVATPLTPLTSRTQWRSFPRCACVHAHKFCDGPSPGSGVGVGVGVGVKSPLVQSSPPMLVAVQLHDDGFAVGHPLKLLLNLHPQTGVDHCQALYPEMAVANGFDPASNVRVREGGKGERGCCLSRACVPPVNPHTLLATGFATVKCACV
jgi:hypothetical protein